MNQCVSDEAHRDNITSSTILTFSKCRIYYNVHPTDPINRVAILAYNTGAHCTGKRSLSYNLEGSITGLTFKFPGFPQAVPTASIVSQETLPGHVSLQHQGRCIQETISMMMSGTCRDNAFVQTRRHDGC